MVAPKKPVAGPKKERRPPLKNEQVVEMVKNWDTLGVSGWADKFGVTTLAINAAASKMRKLNPEYCPKKSKRMGFDPDAVARLLKG